MFFTPKTNRKHESGFTMIELLVVVVIIAILAAIAVPVYLNIKAEAARSALKSDVNATVKKVSIALTQDTPIDTIVANSSDYIPAGINRGEVISIVPVDSSAVTATTASLKSGAGLSDGAYVIRSATYGGTADGVAHTRAAASTINQYFFVYGALLKTQGAPVDYAYSYTSVGDKYSQGSGDGTSTTASAPVLAVRSLPTATIGSPYTGVSISATGTPAPTLSATGLPVGLSMDGTGAISGTPNDAAKSYTVHVTAKNGVAADTKDYTLNLVSPDYAPSWTGAAAGSSLGSLVQGAKYTGTTPVVSADAHPAASFSAPTGATSTATAALPKGLSMLSDGTLSGTLNGAAAGTYTFDVTASNSVSSIKRSYKFTVTAFTPIPVYTVSNSTPPYITAADWVVTTGNASVSSNQLNFNEASYGAYGQAYHTISGLQVGHTYALSTSLTVGSQWSGNNCAAGGTGYSTTSTTSMTQANSFTATADTMRVYVWGQSNGLGTLRCIMTDYSVKQTS